MNPKTTKTLAIAAIAAMAPLMTARATDTLPHHWTDDARKIVTYAPEPELKISVARLAADDDAWDQLSVDLQYTPEQTQRDEAAIRAAFPGYEARRAVLSKHGDFTLAVPALDVQETVAAMPGVDGPYFNWTTFVARSRSQALRDALARSEDGSGAVTVTGQLAAEVPQSRAVERIEAGPDACDALFAGGSTLFTVIQNYAKLKPQLDQRPARYPSTITSLERSVLETCVDLSERAAGSFSDLLSTQAQLKLPRARPAGETRMDVPVEQDLQLQFHASKSVQGGGL